LPTVRLNTGKGVTVSNYIEPTEDLDEKVRDILMAMITTKEESETAIRDQYRSTVCPDAQLMSVLEHIVIDEKEHMRIAHEWFKRNMRDQDEQLRTCPFKKEDIRVPESDEYEEK
jgi:hypothetical protein